MTIGGKITNIGKANLWKALYTEYKVSKFKIGVGSTTPSSSDTDLETPISGWNNGDDYGYILNNYLFLNQNEKSVQVRGVVDSGNANGNTITEVGEFFEDGKMFSRDVINPIVKNNKVRIIIEWKHVFE